MNGLKQTSQIRSDFEQAHHIIEWYYLHLQCIRINKQTQFCKSLGLVDSGFVSPSDELVLTPVRSTVRNNLNCLFQLTYLMI